LIIEQCTGVAHTVIQLPLLGRVCLDFQHDDRCRNAMPGWLN